MEAAGAPLFGGGRRSPCDDGRAATDLEAPHFVHAEAKDHCRDSLRRRDHQTEWSFGQPLARVPWLTRRDGPLAAGGEGLKVLVIEDLAGSIQKLDRIRSFVRRPRRRRGRVHEEET